MNKPKQQTLKYLDWYDCEKYLEGITGRKLRDWKGSHKYMVEKVAEIKTEMESAGEEDNQYGHKAFARYKELYEITEPEYCDFWHFLIETQDPQNGGMIHFDKSDLEGDKPEWVKEIIGLILKEFGKGKDMGCEFRTVW